MRTQWAWVGLWSEVARREDGRSRGADSGRELESRRSHSAPGPCLLKACWDMVERRTASLSAPSRAHCELAFGRRKSALAKWPRFRLKAASPK